MVGLIMSFRLIRGCLLTFNQLVIKQLLLSNL
nr:MAG TPA: hypothetical protein [Caudoviricetes sp.]